MEENIQKSDSQDDDRELRRAFQYAANRDRYDQLAELGRQLMHDQNIRHAMVRRLLPWAAAAGTALFCLGFWLGRLAAGSWALDTVPPGQQQIPTAAKLDSFVFYAPSGDKFIVRPSVDNLPGTQAKLEFFDSQGHLKGYFFKNDTLPFLKILQQPNPTTSRQRTTPTVDSTLQDSTKKATIMVADLNNKDYFLNSMLPARRIRVAGAQKKIEPLSDIQVKAINKPDMRCVFYGDRIRLSVPSEMVEGQPVEVLELQGAGTEDGFYLRIGKQFFRLEKSGYSFDLIAIPKPKAFD